MGAREDSYSVWVIALALLAGCGGAATRNGSAAEEGGTAGSMSAGSGGAEGGTAAGGTAGGGTGGGAMGGTPEWLVDVDLDDAFPWFIQDHDGAYRTVESASQGSVHVRLEGSPLETTISTHNHLEVVQVARGVTFRAKASKPLALFVSVKSSLDSDYFAAREAGNDWPVAATPVTTDWTTFEVPFAELAPPETRDPTGMPAFTIAFIVEEESGPAELWLDDVHFF
ncbi:MAG: hypothetical protein K0R38_3545 [Polyangiaceae bacterium]|jgi:hypothetical protein|nr:hypothetical protein [Polyangiaceae bacterium]